ncbi:putative beta-lactamase-like 1 [Montipora foliosa]|uniref:putative beta-lactamase-like 1 n=1 Tax=Montipora foliosa TaxID=591990 RepID=UPI0035F12DFD
MVPWYSKRIRMLTLFLVLFILLFLLMASLFAWRVLYYDSEVGRTVRHDITEYEVSTQRPTTASPAECPVRAKAMQLATLPKRIKDELSEIEETLENKIHGDTLFILANIVYMDKVVWQRRFGKKKGGRSNYRSPKLSDTTVFPVASVTKVLTALMLYKLYHDKKVQSLDDPFKNYMPGFSIRDPFDSHDITLREMVSHMSGLPREAPCFSRILEEQGVCQVNNSIMIERIKNLSLIVQPGNKVSYSNLGFGLLGQGLAASQNSSYDIWMKENIFDPLEMNNSGFKLTPEVRQKIPVGYLEHKPHEPAEWGWGNPAGGMFTSIEDIAKLEIKLFNSTDENDFLSPVITEEFFSPAYILDGKQFIGSPWEMQFMDGYVARMKNGYVYGYSSNIFLFPDLKLAFNVFNAGVMKGCETMAYKLLKAFHHELTALDYEQERTFPAKEAAPFLGEFQTDDVPTIKRVVIRHRNGKLLFYVNEFQFHLNHVRGMTFELIDRRKVNCLPIVIMGVNHEKVHFHPPITDYISPGFTVFGFNLQGKAYFYRKANIP